MNCSACSKESNYVFCEECLAWLMRGETEMVSFDRDEDGEFEV